MIRQQIENLGGRRFLMASGCGIVCTILVWFGKISDQVFATVVLGTVAVYTSGNTYQKTKEPANGRTVE